jgi:hypothetical protein
MYIHIYIYIYIHIAASQTAQKTEDEDNIIISSGWDCAHTSSVAAFQTAQKIKNILYKQAVAGTAQRYNL